MTVPVSADGCGYLLRMPLADGTAFAGYTILRLLGSGGMGEVYLAQHPRLPRRDALKLLPRTCRPTRTTGCGSAARPTWRRPSGTPTSWECMTAGRPTQQSVPKVSDVVFPNSRVSGRTFGTAVCGETGTLTGRPGVSRKRPFSVQVHRLVRTGRAGEPGRRARVRSFCRQAPRPLSRTDRERW